MGIDGLDIIFRLAKEFGISLPNLYATAEQRQLKQRRRGPRHDPTAGEIHANLCEFFREIDYAAPADSWQRVQKCVGEALVVPPDTIQPADHIVADLGAT